MPTQWKAQDIPDQTGRVAIVTGSNSGIGFETARELARKGATVVLACRSESRGREAVARIRAEQPQADVQFRALDLADLDQVSVFAEDFLADFDRLDLLINNAGVMMPPASKTKQGFELQFGVNHLGHFALTGHLIERLNTTPGSRVVVVSSLAHRQGKMNFDDLDFEAGYRSMAAYGQSKLSNLLFARELQRRLEAAGATVQVTAAHPGWTVTNLQQHTGLFRMLNPLFGMRAPQGALPTLYAATAPEAENGGYYGPGGLTEMRGYPRPARTTSDVDDRQQAARLWEVSERRTGVQYGALAAPARAS